MKKSQGENNMESEKVKNVKKALKQNIKTGIGFLDEKEDKMFFVSIADILTLINELESENSYQKEHIELWFKKNEEKKKRIAELEKEIEENAFYSKGYAQGIKNTYEVVMPDKLKQFAEMLKEKFNDTEYRAMTKRKTISVEELKAQMDWILHEVVIKNIDETLKECIK